MDPLIELYHDSRIDHFDGRPSTIDPRTCVDELWRRLMVEHGPDYAEKLLEQDAALRDETAKRKK